MINLQEDQTTNITTKVYTSDKEAIEYCKTLRVRFTEIITAAKKFIGAKKSFYPHIIYEEGFIKQAMISDRPIFMLLMPSVWGYLFENERFPLTIDRRIDFLIQLEDYNYLKLKDLVYDVNWTASNCRLNPEGYFNYAFKLYYGEEPQLWRPTDPNTEEPTEVVDWTHIDYYKGKPNHNVKLNLILPNPEDMPYWGEEYEIKIDVDKAGAEVTHFLILVQTTQGINSTAFYCGSDTIIKKIVSNEGERTRFHLIACEGRNALNVIIHTPYYYRW